MWDQTRLALDFFQNYLPFSEMQNADDYTDNAADYCLIMEDDVYVVYLPEGGTTLIDLSRATGDYVVNWYDPRVMAEACRWVPFSLSLQLAGWTSAYRLRMLTWTVWRLMQKISDANVVLLQKYLSIDEIILSFAHIRPAPGWTGIAGISPG